MKLTWTQIVPEADPEHGNPSERSSHGLSILHKGSRLVLYGGEKTARTPMEPSQEMWAADYVNDNNNDDIKEKGKDNENEKDKVNDNEEKENEKEKEKEKEKDGVWTWRLIDSSSSSNVPPARVAHSQAVYNDSVVYVFGGRAGITMNEQAMNDLWKLDCSGAAGTETWSLVTPDLDQGDSPPEERSFHRMLCVGTHLYVFGGCGANGRLADIHVFDIVQNTWTNMGASSLIEGRGGPNFMTFSSGKLLGVVAGFCGMESNDGHIFDLSSSEWRETDMTDQLQGLRPRSVSTSASLPSTGLCIIFGGEVDPSQKGHEGAGGFENDVVLLEESTGTYLRSIQSSDEQWPETRGWAAGTSLDDGDGLGKIFLFGGLSGDDTDPKRLNDLWRLDVQKL